MGKLLVMLATGPLMILGVVLAVPVALLFMALGGAALVFTLWTLIWGAIWVTGSDPDAGRYFLAALGTACAAAASIVCLTWGIASLKDWVVSPKRPTKAAVSPSPTERNRLAPTPANDDAGVIVVFPRG